MQRFLFIMQFVLLAIATPAWSVGISSNCEAQAQSLKGSAHDKFLVSCLAKESSPDHVRAVAEQKKRKLCEQNAKNQNLAGGKQSSYINTCMNSNDAQIEARRYNVATPVMVKNEPAARNRKVAAVAAKQEVKTKKIAAKNLPKQKTPQPVTCKNQADQQSLKGDTRKKFLSDCRKG